MTMTPLPVAPLPTDSTATFNSRAFALVAALGAFVTEANALEVAIDADVSAANTSKNNAATSATNASTSASTAAASATLATTKATSATASATSASTSATQSAQSAADALTSKNAATQSATQAASSVSAQNIPSSLIGQRLKILKVNDAETGYDLAASVATPRFYGFALSADSTEILLSEENSGSLIASNYVSWLISENVSFSIQNNELAVTL
jgi:hypothetical protein